MLHFSQLLTLATLSLMPQGTADDVVAPARPTETVIRQGVVMGAPWQVTVQGIDRPAALASTEIVLKALTGSEQRLSNWKQNSELSKWNRTTPGQPLPCGRTLAQEIARAEHWSRITSGAFSPLAEPLVQAWDLRGEGRVPSAIELNAALLATRADGLTWQDEQPIRAANVQVASGGFGKGAAMDCALRQLAPLTPITLNVGGQVLVQGRTESIQIAHPVHRQLSIANWELSSGSLATSGNSERGITVDGTRFSHIIDARTGQPARDFGSVTVWCENALDADCLSTALFALGPDEGLKLAATLPGVRALFVELHEGQPRLRATRNCQEFLSSQQPIQWFLEPLANHPTPNKTGMAQQ